jgi:hypothetical protein
MKVFTPRWRKWTTVLLGAYLFMAPWIFGTSEDEASSANAWIVGAWIVGACIVVVTLRVQSVSGPRAAELIKVGLGAWLLTSPFDPRSGQHPESRLRLLELDTRAEPARPGAQYLPGEAPPVRRT